MPAQQIVAQPETQSVPSNACVPVVASIIWRKSKAPVPGQNVPVQLEMDGQYNRLYGGS